MNWRRAFIGYIIGLAVAYLLFGFIYWDIAWIGHGISGPFLDLLRR